DADLRLCGSRAAVRISRDRRRPVCNRPEDAFGGGAFARRGLADHDRSRRGAQHLVGHPVGGVHIDRGRVGGVHDRIAVRLRDAAGSDRADRQVRRPHVRGGIAGDACVRLRAAPHSRAGDPRQTPHPRGGPGRRRPHARNATWSSDMTNGVSVELNDLSRGYGSVKALDGLTLHIEPGELVALLGPSGCGKTTALRILAGLDEATSGTVSVDGKDLTRVPANKRDMGMVFQAYSLFPHLTVLDNVAFGLKMRGKAKSERMSRAADMLDLVGLSAHKDKYANELSGAQQQRVALARALAIQPRVLL